MLLHIQAVQKETVPETEIPAWYTHNAKMELTDTLNEHRDAALRMQFEKDRSLTNTNYCGISVKAGESYSLAERFCWDLFH